MIFKKERGRSGSFTVGEKRGKEGPRQSCRCAPEEDEPQGGSKAGRGCAETNESKKARREERTRKQFLSLTVRCGCVQRIGSVEAERLGAVVAERKEVGQRKVRLFVETRERRNTGVGRLDREGRRAGGSRRGDFKRKRRAQELELQTTKSDRTDHMRGGK